MIVVLWSMVAAAVIGAGVFLWTSAPARIYRLAVKKNERR